MKNKSLIIKPNTHVSLRKVSNLLTITDKILQKSNNKLFEILMNNPRAAVVMLSRFYPFDGVLIEKYSKVLNFSELTKSPYVRWDSSIIEKFKKKWLWENLSENKSLPWDLHNSTKSHRDRAVPFRDRDPVRQVLCAVHA